MTAADFARIAAIYAARQRAQQVRGDGPIIDLVRGADGVWRDPRS